MKPQRRRPIVPEYKARRLARERSAFMLEMVQARIDAMTQWLCDREPRMPAPPFAIFKSH